MGKNDDDKKVTSPAYLAKLLQERGLAPRRSQGQHFLVDENILGRILAGASLEESDYVLDIGAGPGALSLAMAEKVAGVIAVEQDRGLVELLKDQAAIRGLNRLHIVEGDVRRLDLEKICRDRWGRALGQEGRNVKVVANLPYYLTTPLLFQLLQGSLPLKLLVLMVQLEVARRINAEAGQKDYGLLTVLCRYYTNPRFLFKVSPEYFIRGLQWIQRWFCWMLPGRRLWKPVRKFFFGKLSGRPFKNGGKQSLMPWRELK